MSIIMMDHETDPTEPPEADADLDRDEYAADEYETISASLFDNDEDAFLLADEGDLDFEPEYED